MVLILGVLVAVATVVCELAARRGWLAYWVSRKVLHVVAVGACAVAANTVDRRLLTAIVFFAAIGLAYAVAKGWLMREPAAGEGEDEVPERAWGIVWFPMAFLLLLISGASDAMVAFCMGTLAICDPAATVFGKLTNFQPYNLTGDGKTLGGSLAFLLSFFFFVNSWFPSGESVGRILRNQGYHEIEISHLEWLLAEPFSLISIVLALAALEGLGSKGSDNILIPLAAYILLRPDYNVGGSLLIYCLPLASAGFVYWSVTKHKLTLGAAVTAVCLAVFVMFGAGPAWLLPLVFFFGSSVLLGKVFPSRSATTDAKEGKPRDITQVLANGGVYGLLVILSNFVHEHTSAILLLAALCVVATATADTWSSQIGQYVAGPTYDVTTGKPVPTGLSGGISVAGTLAGLAGATLIGLSIFLLQIQYNIYFLPRSLAFITATGFLGMLTDSLLGATLQPTYRPLHSDELLDAPQVNARRISGLPWMTNDAVNFLSTLIIAGLTIVFLYNFPPGHHQFIRVITE